MDVHPTKTGINRYWSIPIYDNDTQWQFIQTLGFANVGRGGAQSSTASAAQRAARSTGNCLVFDGSPSTIPRENWDFMGVVPAQIWHETTNSNANWDLMGLNLGKKTCKNLGSPGTTLTNNKSAIYPFFSLDLFGLEMGIDQPGIISNYSPEN